MSRFLYNPSPAKMCQLYTCCVCLTTCGPLSPTLHTVTDTRDTACLHLPFHFFPRSRIARRSGRHLRHGRKLHAQRGDVV